MKRDDRIEEIIRLMRTDDAVDAPRDAIKWVADLARSRPTKAESPLRRLIAALKVDIGAGQQVFGERSASGATARQMLFEAGDVAVDLRISQAGDRFAIRGQLIAEVITDASVLLKADGPFTARSNVDDFGEFRFDELVAGTYELTVQNMGYEIVIPQIDLS